MHFSSQLRLAPARFLILILLSFAAVSAGAASIRGVVTDASGAKVTGATVDLLYAGNVIASTVSRADGSFEILTGVQGRFYLLVSAKSFRQLETPGFFAGRLDTVERNLVLEPEWVRESIVVTATGTPTPQPQTGTSTTVLGPPDLALRDDLVSPLRLMPGAIVVQDGQQGGQTSLFIRGGDSDSNKILLDGVSIDDLGGRFDFGPLSTTAVEHAEVYRGPDSDLYGADAASGVVSLTTPRGTTNFPSLIFHGDAGRFDSSQEDMELAGTLGKLDYLGEFNWLQTDNQLPDDEYHVATAAANLGFQVNGKTQVRGTVHYGVDGTGVPGAFGFYGLSNDATQKDQDIYFSGTIDNQTTPDFHNVVRYGLTRKREQYHLWTQNGSGLFDAYGDSFGYPVTILGANGDSVTGPALMDFAGTYPQGYQLVSNRDALIYQGDYTVTPHLAALVGFQFQDERGAEPGSTYYAPIERTNYDYRAGVHGDFKNRFFYTLGGDLEHYSLFGTDTTPRAGFSFYVLRPRKGIFSGTRLLFNYGDAIREPSLTDQFYSLYNFLEMNGGQSTVQQLGIAPLAAPRTRTYDGGVEQAFLSQRILFRANFFHNEFGRQLEYVGLDLIPELLPNLSPAQQNQLEQFLQANGAFELNLNTEAYRALGVEATVEGGIGHSIFMRGGYTYLDAVIQRSFANDDMALLGPLPTFDGIPIGADSPLEGARPFRRPPHSGFFTGTYSAHRLTGIFNAAFASRSDDSDFLGGYDINGGNSLLLPNRNLDHGYAKLDVGASYQIWSWLGVYGMAENLTDNQHIAPIGYVSLPTNARVGLRLQLGRERAH
ncbi:MAG TPA: TonB-dependent receptor plug domain-containing protein [Terracidiphilus sp.]|nr:TonB-dependent receptor plug domain-containing protein [Terracidiphilus sp.]